MTKDEAMKLALDFVASISPAFICEATHHKKNERHTANEPCPHVAKQKATYEAIKEALAQPEQDGKCKYCIDGCPACDARKLPQRTWVGLTDEEIQYCVELKNPEAIAEEVEAKLKEKNNG